MHLTHWYQKSRPGFVLDLPKLLLDHSIDLVNCSSKRLSGTEKFHPCWLTGSFVPRRKLFSKRVVYEFAQGNTALCRRRFCLAK